MKAETSNPRWIDNHEEFDLLVADLRSQRLTSPSRAALRLKTLISQVGEESHPLESGVLSMELGACHRVDSPELALELTNRSIRLLEQSGSKRHYIRALTSQGIVLHDLGELVRSKHVTRKAFATSLDEGWLVEAFQAGTALSWMHSEDGQNESAVDVCRKLLLRFGTELDPNRRTYLHNNLASCLCDLGRFEEAAPVIELALNSAGSDHKIQFALLIGNKGRVLASRGQDQEALEISRLAQSIFEQLHATQSIPVPLFDLGTTYMAKERYRVAIPLLEESFSLATNLNLELLVGKIESTVAQARSKLLDAT